MNASGDAAEQVVRMSLEGTEFAVKIVGKGAKEIGIFLIAAMQGAKKTKGKARLASLLKSGKELKVYSLPEGGLKKFAEEAKRYGVLYAALRGIKHNSDGRVDIMCRAEDASKVDRIFERFQIAAEDTAGIRREILQSLEQRAEQSRDTPERPAELAAEAEAAAPQAEKSYAENPTVSTVRPKENPTQARSAESRQSEPISASSRTSAKVTFEDTRDKPSVRRELAEIRAAHAERTETGRDSRQISPKGNPTRHKPPKHKKSKGR